MSNPWKEIENLALTGTADDLRGAKCPACGEFLRIPFSNAGKGAIGISCPKFHRCWIDGISTVPPWTREVGNEIKT